MPPSVNLRPKDIKGQYMVSLHWLHEAEDDAMTGAEEAYESACGIIGK